MKERTNITMFNINGKVIHNITVLESPDVVTSYIKSSLENTRAKFITEEGATIVIPAEFLKQLSFLVKKM